MDGLLDLVRPIATIVVVAVGLYAYALAFIGRRSTVPTDASGDPLLFVVLVPCLNEEAVIGRTVESLAGMAGRVHVVVIDDASDDGSRACVSQFPEWQVTLIERSGPESRIGKGAALNHGLRAARSWGIERLYPPEDIIVVVFDSDSRVSPDFLERVAPYFADRRVVGVQSGVRMFNANTNLLTFWQHLEFVVWGRIFSQAKDRLGSATLGGNGQCVRLSALLALGPSPWRASLTEDLDLSLRLILRGGRIRFCGGASVWQEALPSLRQLIRQRSRWLHGHFVTWEHIPSVLRSSAPLAARLDIVVLLLMPAALAPLAIATIDGWQTFVASLGSLAIGPLLVWYLLAFASAPLTMWALVREGDIRGRDAFIQAHLFLGYTTFWTVAAGKAVWSILRGDRSWAKTSRTQTAVMPRRHPAGDWQSLSAGAGRPARAGVVLAGSLAAVAVLASTGVLVLTARGVADTYQAVTTRDDGGFTMGVAGATGRPEDGDEGVVLAGEPSRSSSSEADTTPSRRRPAPASRGSRAADPQ